MRVAALLLFMLNLALFGWLRGMFGQFPSEGHEPGRLDQQLGAERIRVLSDRDLQQLRRRASDATPPAAAATAPASPNVANTSSATTAPVVSGASNASDASACLEIGQFAGDAALLRFRDRLAETKLADKATEHAQELAGWYAVTVPGLKSRADAERRVEDLRALGERDALIEQTGTPPRFTVLLGVWRDREQARKQIGKLERRGFKGAQAAEGPTSMQTTRIRLRGLDAAATAQVNALQADFPQQKLQPCPTEPAP
jgi:hypothetical protein